MINVELPQLIKTLDKESHLALEQAAQLCVTRGGNEVLCEDFILAALNNPQSFWNKACQQYNVSTDVLIEALQHGRKSTSSESNHPVLSTALIEWLQESYLFSMLEMQLSEVLAANLLLTLLSHPNKYGHTPYYRELSVIPVASLKQQVEGLVSCANQDSHSSAEHQNALDAYTTNYTQLAKDNKIDPVLCRDSEIRQMIDILARRRKNNPMIVGEAGVGKTALVEGLAIKIAQGEVPDMLENVALLSLDLGLLQAGASIKGEFERRLNLVITAVQESPTPIILFIDEAHTLIGAGGQAGSNDAANLLKPALARGELRTIGATTWSEYKKYIEKDPALARRFQPVKVNEPNVTQAVTILRGLAERYEESHGVYVRDDAIIAAAELSARYISGRQLPDKAIDLLDTACARVKINLKAKPESLETLLHIIAITQRELDCVLRDQQAGINIEENTITQLKEKLSQTHLDAEQLEQEWQTQKELAESLLNSRINIALCNDEEEKHRLICNQQEIHQALSDAQHTHSLVNYETCPSLVAEVVSHWTGIPMSTLQRGQATQVLTIKSKLKEQIKGQDQAVIALEKAIQATAAGLNNPNSPTGVFLFVGPSGVGKTQTAQAIADLMYGGEQFLTTINMSEFQEKHTVSRLIGSPPGYIGYGEGGVLTEAVRQRPYSVVLLDEVEKADPEIMNLFYQIFDKGVANDGEGREINFKQTLIIMTSNLASDQIEALCNQEEKPTTDALTKAIRPTLNQYFKPALVGRMTVVPFFPLDMESMEALVDIRLKQLTEQLSLQQITLHYDEAIIQHIAQSCTLTETGARNIDAIINGQLKPAFSSQILLALARKEPLTSISLCIDENGQVFCEFED
ncbi:type VI secretion system ATPase TssH [Aliivibrio fischeri]|uniref:type VI secretion system ATPase TssH n=1 Tax=Aliivibrio fischeri TaxID=668 RepID=UPI0002D8562C|nr:type VI secretion system ATPase TssH [Aliivibrio fischeri]OCH03628.1 ClpV1 family T6SS ATPase [Aliivibrio fischeri]OEE27972.1 ClpV1 family T6SS ATPase [Aliivibrio fischeri ZF-211]